MKKLLLVLLILIGIPAFILAIPFLLVSFAISKLNNQKQVEVIGENENEVN